MSAYVIVQLTSRDLAKRTRGDQAILMSRDVKRLLSKHAAELIVPAQLEAAGDGAPLSATIAVPDMARADKLAAALCGLDGIETAYAKPGEELP